MSEVLFNTLTAAFALLVTMGWLAGMTLFSVKYFEARMKEKERGQDSISQDAANHS